MKIELELISNIKSQGKRYSVVCPACRSTKSNINLDGARHIIEYGIQILRGYSKYESGNCGYDEDYIEGYDYCAACHTRIKGD